MTAPTLDERDRFAGCLLGLAIGDALGHPTEFLSMQQIHERFGERGVNDFEPAGHHPVGTVTDDTQMTICVARALVRGGLEDLDLTMPVLAEEFVAWSRSPLNDRAPGKTCMIACEQLANGTPWRKAGVAESKGCGAAMRAAPLGLVFYDDDERLLRWSAAQAVLTHRHPTAIASSVAAAAPIAQVMRTGSLDGAIELTVELLRRLDRDLLVEVGCPADLADPIGPREMIAALEASRDRIGDDAEDVCTLLGGGWVGEEAVAAAMWCAKKARGDFRTAVLRGANSSGDSDSIACIAGSFVGAMVGMGGISRPWVRRVEGQALLRQLADALWETRSGVPGVELGASLDPFGAQNATADLERTIDESGASSGEITNPMRKKER
jgi:ADP-ribosylglycohydrolase